jgi:hypothetical protein
MRLRILATVAAAAVLLTGCATAPSGAHAPVQVPAQAEAEPPTSEFDPGYIVSDDSFYDSDAMSESEIQDLFESVSCRADDGVACLADYRETTDTQPDAGAGHCTVYRGAARERASRIVERVADACRVSPRTLIVLLQKEQSLLTRPTERGYLRATGYGCPDTADCDEEYFGFFNQVYHAAWQFRQYSEVPERRYKIGTVDVQYHPDPACGATPVAIRNQATANLYNYTPYQPSPATLEQPDAGDACSAFGNLNFWRIWHRWFGDPTAERYPGFLPACTRLIGGDPCSDAPVSIPTAPAALVG